MESLGLRPRLSILLFSAAMLAAAAACGDLKSATPDGTSGSGSPDAGTAEHTNQQLPANTGPGDHGSLPSGYCCNADSECRDRHCQAVAGGARMCMDACREQGTCERRDLKFKCNAPTTHDDGWCEPETASFTCLPQATFQRGLRQVGECCAWTGDGNSGEECEGNKCIAKGINGEDGPFVCSQHCETTKECPSGSICGPWGTCDPANFPYTCK
jgi:hypothetical protein